ncbi:MAG: DedA family protein [Gammaproteobacteria bacterium]|jgi:membrane protein DedA with SNARE-associated domain
MDFSVQSVMEHYGYPAVLVGTFFEGEMVLVFGGIAAKLGYLKLPGVIIVAFVGTLLGDQLYFYLGRHYGGRWLRRSRLWRIRARRIERLLRHRQVALMLGYRFVYGIRTVTPFVLGISRVSPLRFLAYNLVSALVWAFAVGVCGYALGHVAGQLLEDVYRYQQIILLAGVVVSLMLWWIYRAYRIRDAKIP